MKIGILGSGSWGTAIGILLSKNGHEVKIWDRKRELIDTIRETGRNSRYLPGVDLPSGLEPVYTLEECIRDAGVIIFAVPSQAVRNVCSQIGEIVRNDQIFVNLAKGIENSTLKRVSEVIEEYFPENRIVVLSGPSHAEEVSRDVPTTVTVTSRSREAAEYIQDIMITPSFRVYTNPDIVGVEIGGAVKNIIALAAGISDGLGFGDNTKAALMTRGITEIARLGTALGAETLTFAGLSGIGDLIVTCTSMHSRNRRAGILIGKGKSVAEAIEEVQMVVEGVSTTKSTYELSQKLEVRMPITEELYRVIFEGKNPREAVADLMLRSKTHEIEEIAQRMW